MQVTGERWQAVGYLHRLPSIIGASWPRTGTLVKDYMWLAEGFELKATYVQFNVALNYMLLGDARSRGVWLPGSQRVAGGWT